MPSPSAWREELTDLFLLAARDRRLLAAFLDDLCSPAELDALASRWQIVKQLARGAPHRDIADNVGVAIATVTRGSRMLKNPHGGFARLIHMILTVKHPNRAVQAWRNQLME